MMLNIMVCVLMACAPPDSVIALDSVTITGTSSREQKMSSSQNSIEVTHQYLENHFAPTLAQSLEGIAGVQSSSIGSGQSKPAIRGLGFNRLAVVENGIKHEGQQWGDDHGLEIDQMAVDRVEVIKGPAALLYGSDAIGGVLSLRSNRMPTAPLEGSVATMLRSNNLSAGFAANVGGRNGRFFYKANMSASNFADYRVPADSIQYYSYYIRLNKQRMRNTAGSECNGSAMVGFMGSNFHTDLRVSEVYSKSGFFANAHGLEVRLSGIDYDRSDRDVDLPAQTVNHLKVHSHTVWFGSVASVEANVAWQNNRREELSEPVSHGYMPTPPDSLERGFDKNTFSANLVTTIFGVEGHTINLGLSGELQNNRSYGWGFIIPNFTTATSGLFLSDRVIVSNSFIINAGLRYDYAETTINPYRDWYRSPTANGDSAYVQRAPYLHKRFNSFTWSVGASYSSGLWVFKANVGKGFRMPIPKEFGANGVNYHISVLSRATPT